MADVMKLGLILSATDKMSRVIDQAVGRSSKKLKAFTDSANRMSNKMMVAGGVVAAGIYKSIQAAEADKASTARLNNVFKTMWGDSGAVKKAAANAAELADKMQLQIGVDDDIIKGTIAKLATFKNVSSRTAMMSGVFERATKAAHDMAAVGFGEASQNAVLLGKALQDPMRMATAMKKQGTLTAQDIINVQSIYKTKGLLAAQKEILAAVERQVKGTGKATAKATDIMKVGWGMISESIGQVFLPTVDKAGNKVSGIVPKIISWVNNHHKLIQTVAKLGIGLLVFGGAMKVIAFSITTFQTLFKVISFGLKTISFLMKGFILMQKAFIAVSNAMKVWSVATKIMTAVQWLFNASLYGCPVIWIVAAIMAIIGIVYLLVKNWSKVTAFFKKLWQNIKDMFMKAVMFIKDLFMKYTPYGIMLGLIIKHWAKIKAFFTNTVKSFAQFGKNIIKALVNGITSLITSPIKAIEKIGSTIKNKFKSLFGIHSPSKVFLEYGLNMNKGLAKGIEQGKSVSMTATRGLASSTSNSFVSNQGGAVSLTYAPNVTIMGGSVSDKESFAKMLRDHKRELEQMLNEINSNKQRTAFAS